MAAGPVVEVVGMRAVIRDLAKATDPRAGELIKVMQQAGRQVAQPIAAAARSAVPHDSGRANPDGVSLASDIRVTASRTGAAVRAGRKGRLAYAGWIEFGGTRRRPHPSARQFVSAGRFLFPAARGRAAQTARAYEDALQRGLDSLPWTNPGSTAEGVHD